MCVCVCVDIYIFEIKPMLLIIYILPEMLLFLFLYLFMCYMHYVIIIFYMEEIKKSIFLCNTNRLSALSRLSKLNNSRKRTPNLCYGIKYVD